MNEGYFGQEDEIRIGNNDLFWLIKAAFEATIHGKQF